MAIDCVLPATRGDWGYFVNLFSTFKKFYKCGGNLYIIVPDSDYHFYKRSLENESNVIVFNESFIVPEFLLPRYEAINGWRKQQVIKLVMHNYIDSEFYLTLDCDCLFIKDLREEDLVSKGRAVIEFSDMFCLNWYQNSSKVLDINLIPEESTGVTPYIYSKKGITQMVKYLDLRAKLKGEKNYVNHLLNYGRWSENSLYHIFLEKNNLLSKYHFRSDFPLSTNCLWVLDENRDFSQWDAKKSFSDSSSRGYFTVVQSNTGISPDRIREKIKDFI